MDRSLALAVVVLAAGAGGRFSKEPGAKMLAELDGMPVLAHVLREVRSFAPAATVVVLGHGADRIEQAIDWADEVRLRNHAPQLGLASSLQLGIHALRATSGSFDGAFIVLGDQPLLRAEVMRQLAAAAASSRSEDRPIVVPDYRSDAGPRNPALLLRPAWSWVGDIEGDHGLAPLIASRPDATLTVPVSGEMPDVDTVEDLRRLQTPRSH
jgi:molybdenum cofactor cytidylyltransferase